MVIKTSEYQALDLGRTRDLRKSYSIKNSYTFHKGVGQSLSKWQVGALKLTCLGRTNLKHETFKPAAQNLHALVVIVLK